ncbi:hypothetical protein PAMP_019357 [Pampus punctatissimus]
MKTLSFTVGLLLLLTVYCIAMPHGLNEASPKLCCMKFSDIIIPKMKILSITKTHSGCQQKGFVFKTDTQQICISQSKSWAIRAFNQWLVS